MALRSALPGILSGPDKVRATGLKVAASLGIKEVVPTLRDVVRDNSLPGSQRATSLLALNTMKYDKLGPLVDSALTDPSARLRVAARKILAKTNPKAALPLLADAVASDDMYERQQSYVTLADMPQAAATRQLADSMRMLLDNQIPADTKLDVLTAAEARRSDQQISKLLAKYEASLTSDDPLSTFRTALVGGNADRGERIFLERTQVSYVRCHRVGTRGGAVGPELTKIAKEKKREYLLEAIVQPNKVIAKGFETAVIIDIDGKVQAGIVKQENDEHVQLLTADGQLVTILQDDIDARRAGESAMPSDLIKHLSAHDLRDLVQYLSELK